jgi:hypothetical protein
MDGNAVVVVFCVCQNTALKKEVLSHAHPTQQRYDKNSYFTKTYELKLQIK